LCTLDIYSRITSLFLSISSAAVSKTQRAGSGCSQPNKITEHNNSESTMKIKVASFVSFFLLHATIGAGQAGSSKNNIFYSDEGGDSDVVAINPSTSLTNQIICGYQGWFAFPGDGAPINKWKVSEISQCKSFFSTSYSRSRCHIFSFFSIGSIIQLMSTLPVRGT